MPQFTKREHFVPQGYLKQFSEDGKRVLAYDLLLNCKETMVGTKDICVQNDLYEDKDNKGQYIARNATETVFSVIENEFYAVVNMLKNAVNPLNCGTAQLLSKREWTILIIMAATQALRMPEVIAMADDEAEKYFQKADLPFANFWARRSYLPTVNLPIDGLDNPENKAIKDWLEGPPVLMAFCNRLEKMQFAVGYDLFGKIATSDKPVFMFKEFNAIQNTKEMFNFDYLMYPLSPNFVFFAYEHSWDIPKYKNNLFLVTKGHRDDMLFNLAITANRWIITTDRLTENQIEEINEIRKGKT